MPHPKHSPAARAALLLVALALVAGLPQFLVRCTPAGAAPHVEFACGAECGHGARPSTAGDPADDHGGDRAAPAPPDCLHVALGCELAPAPPAVTVGAPDAAATGEPAVAAGPARSDDRCGQAWADATGPPRPKPILGRIATTVLRR